MFGVTYGDHAMQVRDVAAPGGRLQVTLFIFNPFIMKKETILELMALAMDGSPTGTQEVPFEIGKAYFIRTVTYHMTGRVKAIKGNFLVLEDAAWIADSGRFSDAIKSGEFKEVEPVEDAIVNMGSISDAFEIKYKLPRKQL